MCYQQCSYVPQESPRSVSCYLEPGSTTQGYCNFIIESNGENCSAESYEFSKTGDALNPADTPDAPPSNPDDPLCPDGWTVSNGTCYKTRIPIRPTPPILPTQRTQPNPALAAVVMVVAMAPVVMAATVAAMVVTAAERFLAVAMAPVMVMAMAMAKTLRPQR